MTIRASIIIRTYNESRYLPDLLRAIGTQTIPHMDRETVVVDSGSTDNTKALAEEQGCRLVHIPHEQFSFGRSLNLGCSAAMGRTLVFISGHCVPTTTRWLEALIEPIETKAATLAYGRQVAGPATMFSEEQIFNRCYPPAQEAGLNGYFCNNANAAISADAWATYRFDEELTGLEDMHLGKRIVEAGHRIAYVPQAIVAHHHHESWRKVTNRFEREALALQKIMPEIHIGLLDVVRYVAAGVGGDALQAITKRRFLKNAWPILAYRLCQYYGSWKGNHEHRALSRQKRERYFYP